MSHFSVLVFGKQDDVDRLLKPYDENIEVEEYWVKKVSQTERDEFVEFYLKENTENRGLTFEQLYTKNGNDWNGGCWIKDNQNIWSEYSTYNPQSKWDWYEIGGRWNKSIRNNECLSKSVKKDFIPFAFVDQDGLWHERAEMGWWAMTKNEKEDDIWEKEFKNALDLYNGYVTLVDCHI